MLNSSTMISPLVHPRFWSDGVYRPGRQRCPVEPAWSRRVIHRPWTIADRTCAYAISSSATFLPVFLARSQSPGRIIVSFPEVEGAGILHPHHSRRSSPTHSTVAVAGNTGFFNPSDSRVPTTSIPMASIEGRASNGCRQ